MTLINSKKTVLACIVAVIAISSVSAERITKNDIIYEVDSEAAIVVGFTGENEKISVPKTINGKPVIKVENRAFVNNINLKAISLGENITEIGEEAFSGCDNLKVIYVRNMIDEYTFGKNCFSGCEEMTVKFKPAQKIAAKADAPKRQNMVYVQGNGDIKSFYIDKYEVNYKEYLQYMKTTNRVDDDKSSAYTEVWQLIIFCNKLSVQEGRTPCYSFGGTTDIYKWNQDHFKSYKLQWNDNKGMIHRREGLKCNFDADGYRLPTVEEWLYAARGGKNPSSFKYSGSDILDEVAINAHISTKEQPSGMLKPNKLGIYDMSGNAAEICFEKYLDDGKPAFIHCGGAYNAFDPSNAEKYMRINEDFKPTGITFADMQTGFRLVCRGK